MFRRPFGAFTKPIDILMFDKTPFDIVTHTDIDIVMLQ